VFSGQHGNEKRSTLRDFVNLANTAAHVRIRLIAATLTALALILAPAALAADSAGGTSAGGTSAGGVPAAPKATTPVRPSAHVTSVRIIHVTCVPAAKCATNPHQVSLQGTLLVQGVGLTAGMVVAFPKSAGATISRTSPASRLRATSAGLVVSVPATAHSGRIKVLLTNGRYTSSYGPITVVAHALHPPAPKVVVPVQVAPSGGVPSGTALDGQGMWIWYVSQSSGGSVPAIIARAKASGVTTVFVKSSDGPSNYWSQFSPQLVAEMHAAGLKICAWQYVYGSNPAGEAAMGAEAVANGADCLVIDAESEYEGHYAAAQKYITDLRAKIGASYPLALASFPYVSYHESFPYSVFLGPDGAQYNAPQMYWKAIGNSVDTVYANTYIANRMYGRQIFPLGQTYEDVSASDLLRFREEAVDYGASGWSFWDWQETSTAQWADLPAPLAPLTTVTPNTSYPELSQGSKGDQTLWMQEHLADAIPAQATTGAFDAATKANLITFQSTHGIPASGVTDAATWAALLALPPVPVAWTGSGPAG
jgi:peptidoglycan hydrolase-like protein with peptidoglycan-binding domain